MSKEILIQVAQDERRVAVLVDGKLDDFYIELDRHQSMLGNIYKGKVESILPSINGAFVNIGREKNGFLYLTDADNPFLNDIEKIEEEPSTPQKILNMIFPKPAEVQTPPPQGNSRPPKKDKNELPLKETVVCGNIKIGGTHGHIGGSPEALKNAMSSFKDDKMDVVIFGHSHQALSEKIGSTLYFNPGSPNDFVRAKFISYGLISIEAGKIKAEIIKI